MKTDRRLIEQILPIRSISEEAAREKSIRQGNISTLHIWWARRPLAACRAVILGALLRDPQTEGGRKDVLEFVENFCRWEGSNDSKMVQRAVSMVRESNDNSPPKLLDCFAGGGAIPLEALRLGCEAHALELNPVAVAIENSTLVYPEKYGKPAEVRIVHDFTSDGRAGKAVSHQRVANRLAYDLERWGKWVLAGARKELQDFFPSDSDGSVPGAFLWARTVTCQNPRCRGELPLLRQFWLANNEEKKIAVKLIPDSEAKKVRFEVVKGHAIDFDPKIGTMKLGTARCPICGHTSAGEYLREEAAKGRMGHTLMAVVTSKLGERGKSYRAANAADLKTFNEARNRLASSARDFEQLGGPPDELLRTPNVEPEKGSLPPFYVHMQVVNYGLRRFSDLFNSRQLLTALVFASKVRKVPDLIMEESHDRDYAIAVATMLSMALDRLADYSTLLGPWAVSGEFRSTTFGRQVIPMVWDYTELNPLTDGSGGWESALGWVLRVVDQCSGIESAAHVQQGTATRLPYSDSFFDAVITDPPYYDAVPYSDLSDFFYVWLRRTIGPLYPELFSTPLTPKAMEIIQESSLLRRTPKSYHSKGKEFFESQMAKAFHEMQRVLKPEGVCVVVFAHKTTTAWEALIAGLLDAGFCVTASWPLHTERPGRLRAHESAALASSVWLVCRKRPASAPVGSWKQVQGDLEELVKARMDFFLSQGIRGADALLSAIGPALEVFGQHARVEKVTGESVPISEFLDKVREVVSRHALATVLEGRDIGAVDPTTAFYVLWKWSYESREDTTAPTESAADSLEEDTVSTSDMSLESRALPKQGPRVPVDDALKLARSIGAEFDELTAQNGILAKAGETVTLRAPAERWAAKGLGEPTRDGRAPPLVDILHRAAGYWAAGEKAALEEYLDSSGARADQELWKVAGALSRILPLDSPEKRVIDGLWAKYGAGSEEGLKARRDKGQTTLEGFEGGN